MSPRKRSGLDFWKPNKQVVIKVMRADKTIHRVYVEVEEISRLNFGSLYF